LGPAGIESLSELKASSRKYRKISRQNKAKNRGQGQVSYIQSVRRKNLEGRGRRRALLGRRKETKTPSLVDSIKKVLKKSHVKHMEGKRRPYGATAEDLKKRVKGGHKGKSLRTKGESVQLGIYEKKKKMGVEGPRNQPRERNKKKRLSGFIPERLFVETRQKDEKKWERPQRLA